MKRRKILSYSWKAALGLMMTGPYASAIEHLNQLNLPRSPDPFQKKMIDSNMEFRLAIEDAKGDPCDYLPMAAKIKCRANGGV